MKQNKILNIKSLVRRVKSLLTSMILFKDLIFDFLQNLYMAITKKLVHFKTQANFDKELNAGNIADTSIVFIKDTQRIWTHGTYFSSLKEALEQKKISENDFLAGDNITIDKIDNKLRITGKASSYTLPVATTMTLGGVYTTETDRQGRLKGISVSSSSDVNQEGLLVPPLDRNNSKKTSFDLENEYLITTQPDEEHGEELSWVKSVDYFKALQKLMPEKEAKDPMDEYSYGIRWKLDGSNGLNCERIGNEQMHLTLPIQSGMKGCIYNAIEKKVVYWLDPKDWRFPQIPVKYKKQTFTGSETLTVWDNPVVNDEIVTGQFAKILEDHIIGTIEIKNLNQAHITWSRPVPAGEKTIVIGSRLDGYDGEVMVYVPEFWIKSFTDYTYNSVRITNKPCDSTWEHQPAIFIGAYKDTLLKSVPENMGYLSKLPQETAVCVSNFKSYCAGLNGNWRGDSFNPNDFIETVLGKPRTGIPLNDFRKAAQQNHKEILSYKQYKNILCWLYTIEYASFNVNKRSLPSGVVHLDGVLHNFGLGPIITTTNPDQASKYQNTTTVFYNGILNEFGNQTVTKKVDFNVDGIIGDTKSHYVYPHKWRGFENIVGDTWTCVDNAYVIDDGLYIVDNKNYTDLDYQIYKNLDYPYYLFVAGSDPNHLFNLNFGMSSHADLIWDMPFIGNTEIKALRYNPENSGFLCFGENWRDLKDMISLFSVRVVDPSAVIQNLTYRTVVIP
nr:MAG TPA: hypothetical protein [Caudoviricetes sp.]